METTTAPEPAAKPTPVSPEPAAQQLPSPPEEIGGPKGLEPTRYGDWERRGRCIDF
ncbi:MAG TPA: DUF1674 domain-containing protein [Candidatus Macondimonas sp.]|nr:DUF1674 domain-containing protein [Candidatus Macondimonas sp.]